MRLLKYTIIMLISIIATYSYSQPKQIDKITTEAQCFNTNELFKELSEKFKEYPLIIGKTDDQAGSTFTLWANPASKTWTLLATKKDVTCVIGVGTDFNIISYRRDSAL